ncbi:acetyl esterase [Sphingomonas sp. UYAg733]
MRIPNLLLLLGVVCSSIAFGQSATKLNPVSGATPRAELVPFTQAALDGGSREVLERIAARGGPPPWTIPPKQLRESFDAFFAQFSLPDPKVASRERRMIPGPNGPIPISIFRPIGKETADLPVVVYFHGGGMMTNSTDTYDSMLQLISSKAGAAIVSVDYRLAPEHRFPQGVNDSYAALLWVHAHGSALGVDVSRMAVAGDSAGGYMTAVISQMARDQGGPRLRLQVLIYPAVGTRGNSRSVDQYAQGYFFSRTELAWIYAQYVEDAAQLRDPRVQPILAKRFDKLPPALIIVPEFDIMRDDGEDYAGLLKSAGVPTKLHRYVGTIHGFVNMGKTIAAGRDAIDEIATSLETALSQGSGR